MKRVVNALRSPNCAKPAYALLMLCLTTTMTLAAHTPSYAQTFTMLHSFDGKDGAFPFAVLIQATNGNFYGTTFERGAYGYGTAFTITPSGTLTTLYNFCAQGGCTDGTNPGAGLVLATNGNFYGTTAGGGAGLGTVFKITPNGALTTLYNFCSRSNCRDGADPLATLVQATNGQLYGTTYLGGQGGNNGYGTIFKVNPSGTLTTLHRFDGTDGALPDARLLEATDGNFYGTTTGDYGLVSDGTIFKINRCSTLTTLHSFNIADGAFPTAGLIQATNGSFYGTTSYGGDRNGGTIFKITRSGTLTTLYNFCSRSDCIDGAAPNAPLVQATDGDFYGTTLSGGANGYGTIFKITANGTLTTLHSFDGTEGGGTYTGLLQATNGYFYGTTTYGGASCANVSGCGTVFSLSVGLGPFVRTLPTAAKVGIKVTITGTNLTGSTSVTFNGTSAAFTIVSSTEITTTVPAGATTGTVQVVMPSGTLSSNRPFRVL